MASGGKADRPLFLRWPGRLEQFLSHVRHQSANGLRHLRRAQYEPNNHGRAWGASLRSLREITEHVDVIQILRGPEDVPPIVAEAIAIGAKAIWMQPGIINEKAASRAGTAGLKIVMDTCMRATH